MTTAIHADDSYGGCVSCRTYVGDHDGEPVYEGVLFPCPTVRERFAQQAQAALVAKVEGLLPSLDYEGLRHSPACNRSVFPGNSGPSPEPPDPCSCDGPTIYALLTGSVTRGPSASEPPRPTEYGPHNPAPGTSLWRAREHPETMTPEDWQRLGEAYIELVGSEPPRTTPPGEEPAP